VTVPPETVSPENDQHKKSQTIRLRVSPEQKAQLQQVAAEHHLSLSAWLRQLALGQIGRGETLELAPNSSRKKTAAHASTLKAKQDAE
jgi:uncharacterized protein (DUF1778 family)